MSEKQRFKTVSVVLLDQATAHSTPVVRNRAPDEPSVSQSVFTITEKAHIRAFSWLKAPTRAFTFKTLFRHYEVDMKLGRQHNYQAVSCK